VFEARRLEQAGRARPDEERISVDCGERVDPGTGGISAA
jgi:hypothetical protein